MGGKFQREWVASFAGIRTYLSCCLGYIHTRREDFYDGDRQLSMEFRISSVPLVLLPALVDDVEEVGARMFSFNGTHGLKFRHGDCPRLAPEGIGTRSVHASY